MPETGDPAPDFTLASTEGATVSLADLRGRRAVIYFYPKDDTPGCTKQACALRDAWSEITATGAVLYGVSANSIADHEKFRAKYGLPFPLLADTDHAMADAYGTWVEKKNYGKAYMGIERTTFVIDEEGRIIRVLRRVKPDEHVDKVLAALAPAP